MHIDLTGIEEKAAEQAAERDRNFSEAMQKLQERNQQHNAAISASITGAVENTVNAAEEMQQEIEAIEAEAERNIDATKRRYAAAYGLKDWNTTTEDALRELSRSLKK